MIAPLHTSPDTSCRSCCARPTLHRVCTSLTLQQARASPSEAALADVGPTGHVTASDLSPAMVDRARERLGNTPNASVSVEDAQALSFLDESFEAVLCNLGLMFFPDPARGLSEFRRVLRSGRRAA